MQQYIYLVGLLTIASSGGAQENAPWLRHAIDGSLRGADGVRLGDVNQDGLLDLVTGWEESGQVRVYLQPPLGAEHSRLVKQNWPAVTIGKAPSVEDAVFVDLNRDGRLDVLASCEGKEQSLWCFFSPPADQQLDASKWDSQRLDTSRSVTRWMYALPSRENVDRVFTGSKNPNGQVGYFDIPHNGVGRSDGPTAKSLPMHKLTTAGWIMSLEERDVDGDGDWDLVYSDRKAAEQGVYWLENPGNQQQRRWSRHPLGALGEEVMFLSFRRPVGGGMRDDSPIFVAAKPNRILKLTPPSKPSDRTGLWETDEVFAASLTKFSRAKAAAVGDLTGDGIPDLVYSCESADPPRQGVVLLKASGDSYQPQGISGPEGIKFDLIQLVDLDRDGDLDVLTCEERHAGRGLGVIWYENPLTLQP